MHEVTGGQKGIRMASIICRERHLVVGFAVTLMWTSCQSAWGTDLNRLVHDDWATQERRFGRSPEAPQAIERAYERARALLDNLRTLSPQLPQGNYATMALSYDARTLYFGFAERAQATYDYYSPARRSFHIWAVNADGTKLRQLTSGPEDDFDPCPLPDGGIAFMSSRRGGFGRCHNPWEPLPTYTLHRMTATASDVTTAARANSKRRRF